MHTIYILWLRQLKRYFRSKARIVGSLGQPILFLLAFGFGFGPVFAKAGGGNYMEFLAPGIVAMGILFTAVFSGIEIIWDKQFGFLKETLAAPVSRFNIMIGRTLGGATVAVIQGVIVFLLAVLFGFKIENFLLLPMVFLFMFLIALLFTALGTAIASFLEDMQGFQLIMNFVVMPIFFLSGSIFPVDQLPGVLSSIIKLNPLFYGIDGIRQSLTNIGSMSLFTDLSVLTVVTLIFVVIGAISFSKIEI
ncbi:MAG: ABC transporter permease [Candidatus Pacebacteria bacterium]|nr:ABC transporter permease [Candidatus Paceibacterota bacterium]